MASKKVPGLLLAHSWDFEQDVSGWWMSEKLDGIRAYWDGKRFVSRLGNEFFAPKWFTKGLPNEPLDGELFVGRKKFNETASIVKQHEATKEEWERVRYLVFDAPSLGEEFEHRYAALARLILKAKYASLVKQRRVTTMTGLIDVMNELKKIQDAA